MSTRNCLLALILFALAASTRGDVVVGRDYAVLGSPQSSDSPGKIEIIEFFSYGCPHCYDLHPLVSNWSEGLPKDVVFKRVAVSIGHRAWASLARAYYAFEVTGEVAKLDDALYAALHEQRLALDDEQSIADWVGKQGADAGKFAAAFNSFSVNTRVSRAEQMALNYRVTGLPAVVVAGRYVVLGRTYEDLLRIADELIVKARTKSAQKIS